MLFRSGSAVAHVAQHQLFEEGMKRLLRHEALDAMTLIDLLTLVSLKPESREEIAHPFWLALKVADSSCHSDEKKEAKRLIWRRLYIRDDWAKINDTQLKNDQEVVERLVDTELYAMLADCIRFRMYYPLPGFESLANSKQKMYGSLSAPARLRRPWAHSLTTLIDVSATSILPSERSLWMP